MEVGRIMCAATLESQSGQGSTGGPPVDVDVELELELEEEEQLVWVIGIRRPMCPLSCLTCAA